MNQLTAPILNRIVAPTYDQPLFNTQIIDPQRCSAYFFTDERIKPTNFGQGYLYRGQQYQIQRVALINTCENSKGFQELIRKATFRLRVGTIIVLDIPAISLAWADLKEINSLLRSISKLPTVQQNAILRNLKVSEGYQLSKTIELHEMEQVVAELSFDNMKTIKPITVTCMLGGLKRPVYIG